MGPYVNFQDYFFFLSFACFTFIWAPRVSPHFPLAVVAPRSAEVMVSYEVALLHCVLNIFWCLFEDLIEMFAPFETAYSSLL